MKSCVWWEMVGMVFAVYCLGYLTRLVVEGGL
jgi:hypothetical protein